MKVLNFWMVVLLPLSLFAQESIVPSPEVVAKLSFHTLDSLHKISAERGEPQIAIVYATQMLSLVKSQPNYHDTLYASTLLNVANAKQSLGQFEEALSMTKKVLVLAEKHFGKKSDLYASAAVSLGNLYKQLGQLKEAEEMWLEGRQIFVETIGKKNSRYALVTNNLAVIYRLMGRYKEAEPLYLEALAIKEKVVGKHHLEYAQGLNNLGIFYAVTERYELAEPYYLKALKIAEENKAQETPFYASILSNLAIYYSVTEQFETAEVYCLITMDLRKKVFGTMHPAYSVSLHTLGLLYKDMGKYTLAEPLLLETKTILEKTTGTKNLDYAFILHSLGSLSNALNKNKEAETYYKEALAVMESAVGKVHNEYASALDNLATFYEKINESEKALPLLIEAMNIRKKTLGDTHSDYAGSLNNVASTYFELGRFEEAEKFRLKSKELYKNKFGRHHTLYIIVSNSLANQYMSKGLDSLAWDYCLEAFSANAGIDKEKLSTVDEKGFKSILEESKSMDFVNVSLALETFELMQDFLLKKYNNSSNKNKKTSDFETLFLLSETATAVSEHFRSSLNQEEDKLVLFAKSKGFLERALELTKIAPEQATYLAKSFEFAEQNKSILLAEALKTQKARVFGELPDTLALKEQALEKELSLIKKKILEQGEVTAEGNLRSELNELNQEIEAFKKDLAKIFSKYYKIKYTQAIAKAEDIQKQLDDETAFLEYFITDTIVYLFCLTKKELALYPLRIEKKLLNEQSSTLRKVLSDYDFIRNNSEEAYKTYNSSAYWFYKALLQPALEKNKAINFLIIIADGELGHLPFEAFLTAEAKAGQHYADLPYLLKDFKVSYNYSATLWKENIDQPQKKGNNRMLACAAGYGNSVGSAATRTVRAPHLRNLRNALIDLPAARQEVEGLSKLFAGDFFYGKDAGEAAFKEKAGDYGIIHLAMHGILNTQHPILSSLAFTENGDSTEDNFLQAYEISHLQLNAQLVVLSACETGYGKFQQGEGVMSLARSFMYAGVPSLVVSMWQVNDASTSVIMQSFYKSLSKGMDKAEALRQAKLEYIRSVDAIAAHPAFWAPFVQLGDSRPIAVAVRGGGLSMWWIGGGLLAVAAIGGAVAMRRRRKM